MVLADIERLVTQSTGLDPGSIGPSAVERAVRQRLRARGVADLETYGSLLDDAPAELQALIEAVVIAETWFFRDAEAYTALERFVRDEWLRSHPDGVLRILSLPCATGEEPYSIVIALLEAGLPAHRFRVDAVDISERVLQHGRHGVYGRSAFRDILSDAQRRHFSSTAQGTRVSDAVRQPVQFHQGNVFSPGLLQGAAPYDVIFSRNLLIYFDRPTQERAIDVLSALLVPAGILFVGPSETVSFLNRGFVAERTRRAFAFRKPATMNEDASPEAARPLHIVPRLDDRPSPDGVSQAPNHPAGQRAAIEEGTWLANQGRFEEAQRRCHDSIQRHGPSADAFYLLGLIRDAAGDPLEAMSGYQKALYLDPHHEESLVHLALLLEALDRKPEAQRLRVRARRLAVRSGT